MSRTLPTTLLPEISQMDVPDLESVPAELQGSVCAMYQAGVMVGMENGEFQGQRLLTRAELSGVISRLMMPSLRQSADSRENRQMAGLQGNLQNDCLAVFLEGKYYCLFKEYPHTKEAIPEKAPAYILYETDAQGLCRQAYAAPEGFRLSDISVYDNKLYFSQTTTGSNSGALICYDPATRAAAPVFSQTALRSYCFYDGRLFALAFTHYGGAGSGGFSSDRYTFGEIAEGRFTPLSREYSYYDVQNFQPYGYLGKICYLLTDKTGTHLFSYDLETRREEQISPANISAGYFRGHVFYYLAYAPDGGFDRNLYAASIAVPSHADILARLPETADNRVHSLYGWENDHYCLVGKTGKLICIGPGGETKTVLNTVGDHNFATFAGDRVILSPNSFITSNPNEIKVYSLQSFSERTLYGDWMGASCWYLGARFLPQEGQPVYSSQENVSKSPSLSITVTRAFYSGSDLIIQAKYSNESGQRLSRLGRQLVRVYVGDNLAAASSNQITGVDFATQDVETFTFVIGTPQQGRAIDLNKDPIRIEITPSFEYKP